MRLSCRRNDVGYERYRELMAGNDIKCFVDDVEIKRAITADDEEGFVLTYAEDADGKPQLTPNRDALVEERRSGAVRIDIIPRQ